MTVLSVVAALVFSSPDDPAISLQRWAREAPADVGGHRGRRAGGHDDERRTARPTTPHADGQSLGPGVSRPSWSGVTQPIDVARSTSSSTPLRTLSSDPAVAAALRSVVWERATRIQRTSWAQSYSDALVAGPDGDPAKVASGGYGPVPALAKRPSWPSPAEGRWRDCSPHGRKLLRTEQQHEVTAAPR